VTGNREFSSWTDFKASGVSVVSVDDRPARNVWTLLQWTFEVFSAFPNGRVVVVVTSLRLPPSDLPSATSAIPPCIGLPLFDVSRPLGPDLEGLMA
jgi:hypothetical protein